MVSAWFKDLWSFTLTPGTISTVQGSPVAQLDSRHLSMFQGSLAAQLDSRHHQHGSRISGCSARLQAPSAWFNDLWLLSLNPGTSAWFKDLWLLSLTPGTISTVQGSLVAQLDSRHLQHGSRISCCSAWIQAPQHGSRISGCSAWLQASSARFKDLWLLARLQAPSAWLKDLWLLSLNPGTSAWFKDLWLLSLTPGTISTVQGSLAAQLDSRHHLHGSRISGCSARLQAPSTWFKDLWLLSLNPGTSAWFKDLWLLSLTPGTISTVQGSLVAQLDSRHLQHGSRISGCSAWLQAPQDFNTDSRIYDLSAWFQVPQDHN